MMVKTGRVPGENPQELKGGRKPLLRAKNAYSNFLGPDKNKNDLRVNRERVHSLIIINRSLKSRMQGKLGLPREIRKRVPSKNRRRESDNRYGGGSPLYQQGDRSTSSRTITGVKRASSLLQKKKVKKEHLGFHVEIKKEGVGKAEGVRRSEGSCGELNERGGQRVREWGGE